MAIRRRKKPSLVLPLSSMGDIAFLLIIFFMLVSNFMKNNKVELDKASAPELEKQEAAKCSVLLDRDAKIWYEGAASSVGEVTSKLKEQTEKNRDFQVHVTIHKDLLKKDYMPLFEAISEAGAKMILTGEKKD